MQISEEARKKRELQILAYLQQRQKTKVLKGSIKSESLVPKPAPRNMACTFCRKTIVQGVAYVSFRSQGEVRVKGKSLRLERMHELCMNRYLRPGVAATFGPLRAS
jgi:hypothetical protein